MWKVQRITVVEFWYKVNNSRYIGGTVSLTFPDDAFAGGQIKLSFSHPKG
jgi:hypothetical protein